MYSWAGCYRLGREGVTLWVSGNVTAFVTYEYSWLFLVSIVRLGSHFGFCRDNVQFQSASESTVCPYYQVVGLNILKNKVCSVPGDFWTFTDPSISGSMGAYKYIGELYKKKQSDVLRFLLRVRCAKTPNCIGKAHLTLATAAGNIVN